ncbi:MAG: MFS transporter [Proteobacteria bacterium]|nr:MFS transporter [Pseudomonadota bacterium]
MNRNLKCSIAAISGNFIEWYDFALYLFLAPVIAKQFFPTASDLASSQIMTLSLLGTFTVHAVSFFFRPLGALLFGHIGDVYGRSIALRLSLSLLAALSIVMSLLPSYQSIGMMATVLLCLCRIGQGICLGGEFAGSMIYLAETIQPQKRAFFTSLSNNASNIGILIAAGSASILSYFMSDETFSTYGYRILFFIGGMIGVLGFAFRADLKETNTFIEMDQRERLPILSVLKHHRATFLRLFLILNISALGSYAFIGFMSTFLHQTIGLNMSKALRYETLFIAITLILVPFFAARADKCSPQQMLKSACYRYIVLAIPCYFCFYTYQQPLFLLPLVAAYSMEQSCVPALMMEYFPTSVRYTGVSITYNTCMAFIGGLSPILGLLLINTWEVEYGIACLLMFGAIITLISLGSTVTNVLNKFSPSLKTTDSSHF